MISQSQCPLFYWYDEPHWQRHWWAFFSTKLHCHWTSHNLAQYICYYPSSLKNLSAKNENEKWIRIIIRQWIILPPPTPPPPNCLQPPERRNHSGKLLHYYIRQIKHKKHYLKWSDPISAQLCMTIRCNLRRVRTSVHLNHDFQTQNQPIIE